MKAFRMGSAKNQKTVLVHIPKGNLITIDGVNAYLDRPAYIHVKTHADAQKIIDSTKECNGTPECLNK